MKVLVACEFSGIVRDAFTAAGHDATSCDLLPTESPGKHYQGDVRDIIYDGWDMMIAHPPCQNLSYAANRYWNNPGRKEKRDEAMQFFLLLWNAPIEKICIENPQGEPMRHIVYSQSVQPFYFGHRERKKTLLWLKNLPPLISTLFSDAPPVYIDKSGKKRYRTDAISGFNKDAKKERSRFFSGIAQAMANQWGSLPVLEKVK